MTQDELNQKLFEAVENENITEIKSLLNQGANVNVREKDGQTPLHYAAYLNNINIAKLLIDSGADVNVQDEDGWAPLRWAVRAENFDLVKLLIENGADVNVQDKDGCAPLHSAAFWDSVDIIKLLIENGVDPFIKNKDGKIPLDYCKNEEMHKLLENYMNNYKQRNKTPSIENNDLLYYAFDNNLIEVKKCVYRENYNINIQDDKGYTPLMYAIMNHNLKMVEFLIEHGADINLCNNKG